MQVHELKSNKRPAKKRVGRGGKKGTYSGKGMKGQKARSGFSRRPTFEGGRSSLVAQAKKNRGFNSNRKVNQVVNLVDLEKKFEAGEEVNPQTLKEKGLIKKVDQPVKILGEGKLTKKITLKDVLYSKKAGEGVK